jgi:hypothetical protein
MLKDGAGKSQGAIDSSVACKAQYRCRMNQEKKWALVQKSTKLEHVSCGGCAKINSRCAKRLDSFSKTLDADRAASGKVLSNSLRTDGFEVSTSTMYRMRAQMVGQDEESYTRSFQFIASASAAFNKVDTNGYSETRGEEVTTDSEGVFMSRKFTGTTFLYRGNLEVALECPHYITQFDMAHSKCHLYVGQHFVLASLDADNKVGGCTAATTADYF